MTLCNQNLHKIFHKIFNRNTVKISYRTMTNMKQVKFTHTSEVSQQREHQPPPGYNCRGGWVATCPLNGACLTTGVIYEAKVTRTDSNESEFYTGVTVGPFKQRIYGHNYDLRHQSQRTSTCLSKYVWGLKDEGVSPGKSSPGGGGSTPPPGHARPV